LAATASLLAKAAPEETNGDFTMLAITNATKLLAPSAVCLHAQLVHRRRWGRLVRLFSCRVYRGGCCPSDSVHGELHRVLNADEKSCSGLIDCRPRASVNRRVKVATLCATISSSKLTIKEPHGTQSNRR
jgi:hypothetical protein